MTDEIDVRRGWTSASNALADSLCPGRHLAQRGIVPPLSSEDATFGQRIHAALAYNPVNGETANNPGKLSLKEREVFDSCREIEKAMVRNFFGDDPNYGASGTQGNDRIRVFRHQRYWATFQSSDGKQVQHSGEADVVWRLSARVLIADYKTLPGDVAESSTNLQLRTLAVLVRGTYVTIDQAGTVIIQPFITNKPEICVYSREDLQRAEGELVARVLASSDPRSPRVAGEVQCKFCLAKPQCQEYQAWAGQVVESVGMNQVLGIPMAQWSPEQRAVAQECVRKARKFCDEIEEFNKAGLENDPNFVPGWRLIPGSKREVITNPEGVFERFSALGGKVESFMRSVAVRKGKLREEVNNLTGAKGLALNKAIATLVEGYVETTRDAPHLGRADDPEDAAKELNP